MPSFSPFRRTVAALARLSFALLAVAALLTITKLVSDARAEPAPPACTGKKPNNGVNPCGQVAVNCTVANCSTWYSPAPGMNSLKAGLKTDNWGPTPGSRAIAP